MKNKRCLVAGANGFIGRHLTEYLINKGHHVVAFDKSSNFEHFSHIDNNYIQKVSGDFCKYEELNNVVEGCDWVFHLVSTTLPSSSNGNMVYDVQTNITSSIRLFDLCIKHKVQKVIFSSSGGTVYGIHSKLPLTEDHICNPIVSYGITKLAIERYAILYGHIHGLDTVSLRISNPYGSYHTNTMQGVIPIFIKKILNSQTITIWGDGSIVRDYLYISDLVDAFYRAAIYTGGERVFNIGSGIGITLNQLVHEVMKVAGINTKIVYEPSRKFDIPSVILDINKSKKDLGWSPSIPFDEGLRKTWNEYNEKVIR